MRTAQHSAKAPGKKTRGTVPYSGEAVRFQQAHLVVIEELGRVLVSAARRALARPLSCGLLEGVERDRRRGVATQPARGHHYQREVEFAWLLHTQTHYLAVLVDRKTGQLESAKIAVVLVSWKTQTNPENTIIVAGVLSFNLLFGCAENYSHRAVDVVVFVAVIASLYPHSVPGDLKILG